MLMATALSMGLAWPSVMRMPLNVLKSLVWGQNARAEEAGGTDSGPSTAVRDATEEDIDNF